MMQLEELMNKHYKKLNENDFHIDFKKEPVII